MFGQIDAGRAHPCACIRSVPNTIPAAAMPTRIERMRMWWSPMARTIAKRRTMFDVGYFPPSTPPDNTNAAGLILSGITAGSDSPPSRAEIEQPSSLGTTRRR
jgi:hypothetical protein